MNLWLGKDYTGGPSLGGWCGGGSVPFDFDLLRIFAGGVIAWVGAPRLVCD